MATTELKSDAIFELLKRFLGTEEGIAVKNKVNLVYQFNISPKVTPPFFSMIVCVCLDCFLFVLWSFSYGFGLQKIGIDEVVYTIDLKKGEVIKGQYEGGKPDATFSLKDEDFIKLANGKLNPQIAFMRGALKIKGSLSAAQKFTPDIFPKPAKL
ncbi:hypothetical protein H0E87_004704 [Populus deltoides]|uniref:SCP2 domain-containing protein n=1 Tax=Populus deltoides TaxID=3696 RepID=A0A8T2ZG32_POPDE|nr:hypothetical protein H0E87_004704 [Populus deltoides]